MGILGGILGDLVKPVTDIVGKAVVDKDQARELEFKVKELIDKADERYHTEVMGQIEVNKEEAKHSSIFVAGWRPAVGWVGAAGFGYLTLIQPLGNWMATVIFGYDGGFPAIDDTLLITVLGGILGLGGMRSFERNKGVARESMKDNKKPEYLDGVY
ncbi:MAG: hypothetical protein Unbinned2691contig1000_10 [Prokaryotic dsDNA virus sp.]|nr:MAG: hypothetical protein Unbinned2691contig1000_10 [Prokaryotic dsDNA virus sp.]|tara:strand:+ start:35556 stop:36026 length:471 start_codon:yes stop_codon:yes gene_type:complete